MSSTSTDMPDSPASAGRPSTPEKAAMTVVKTDAQDGSVHLIPTPSDDPRDPLNWSLTKKLLVALALCFALFTGMSAPFNGQIQLKQQAELYGKTTVEITYFVSTTCRWLVHDCFCYISDTKYQNSAASGGLLSGSWFWWPLSKKIGRSATILWYCFFYFSLAPLDPLDE